MKRVWTESQRQAIDAKGGSIIVSAAAGSGKTAVLVERVISLITDKDNPVDADRILVVTYTRAAAAELKERLYSKLSELIREEPFNKALLRQQTLLTKANISTIDSFCSSIVKEFFYILGIEHNFRIADESELKLIKKDALKLTLDSMYADGEPDFFHLVEAFGGTKDDSQLENNVLKIHEFLRSHPFPNRWIDEKLSMFTDFDSVSDTVWGKIIREYTVEAINFLSLILQSSFVLLDCEPAIQDALVPLLESDKAFVEKLSSAVNSKGDNLVDILKTFNAGRFPTIKGYTDNFYKIKIQQNRSVFVDTVKKLADINSVDEEKARVQIADLYVISQQLFNCVRQFSDNYQKLKSAKKIADYPDLEHLTIKLLVDEKTLGLTDIALKLQSRFDYIMVDEYQDANEAQDLIFTSLSKNGENLFFVGDVKQSIYGFRQAMPQLFLRRKDNSTLYDECAPAFPAKIFLDKNFRSIQGVTDAVNFYFEKLMSVSVGDIEYDDTESLKCGAVYENESEPAVSYHMLDLSMLYEPDMVVEEAKYIAQTIMRMIAQGYQVKDGDTYRNVTYGDFAVLMRNANKHAPSYVDTLVACGVPAYCNSSNSFLNAPEIMTMTNLLSVIDNPALDIELLSVMMSPIFGFTPDDMSAIRADSRYTSLYQAVLSKASGGDSKCQHFVDELKYYRDLSVTMPVSTLLTVIYERTSYVTIVSAIPNNDLAVSNLRLLKEYAKNYEAGNNKGLSRFVSYISRLRQNDSDIAGAVDVTASSKNAVHVMSIHASKGLEFPVCFICNTSRRFVSDVSQNVLLHSDLGVAVKRKDELLNATFNTMPREALSLLMKRDEMSEELRVLYVAMTRAKQKLIMLSSHKDAGKYLTKIGSMHAGSGPIMPFVVRNCSTISDWIAMCAMLHPDAQELREAASWPFEPDSNAKFSFDAKIVPITFDDDEDEDDVEVVHTSKSDVDSEVVDILSSRTKFEYKNSALAKLPSKVSASDLAHKMSDNSFDRILDTPAFMSDNTLTAAGKGTALHAFMQFCDFKSAKEDIEAEIDRLCSGGFISSTQADSIDRQLVKQFVDSDIITRCLQSDKVYKEYRFTIKVSACIVDSTLDKQYSDKEIILQGAVDLAFVEGDELVIVDYKTDKVDDVSALYAMYNNQLKIYKDAMEQCTDYKVKECLIYSIRLGESVSV